MSSVPQIFQSSHPDVQPHRAVPLKIQIHNHFSRSISVLLNASNRHPVPVYLQNPQAHTNLDAILLLLIICIDTESCHVVSLCLMRLPYVRLF